MGTKEANLKYIRNAIQTVKVGSGFYLILGGLTNALQEKEV